METLRKSTAIPAEKTKTDYTKILIRNMAIDMFIGVYDFEKEKKQRAIVSVEALVDNNPDWKSDLLENTLNYETIVNAIKQIAESGHIQLVETFAEYIVDFCLNDKMVQEVTVTVEKPDIFAFADAVAVEIKRTRN